MRQNKIKQLYYKLSKKFNIIKNALIRILKLHNISINFLIIWNNKLYLSYLSYIFDSCIIFN